MQTQDNSLSSPKHDAVAFYAQNNVTEAIESLLNTMYVDKPEDVYGYMSEYFHHLSMKPVVTSIRGCYRLDGRGSSHLLCLTLYCRINGIDKVVCTYTHPIEDKEEEIIINDLMSQVKAQSGKVKADTSAVGPPPSTSTVTESDDGDQPPPTIDPLKSIKYFEDKLKGISPVDQMTTADSVVSSVLTDDATLDKSAAMAISCLMSVASSELIKSPPFMNLLQSFGDFNCKLSVPTPMMSVITGGQRGIGKLKIRSILLSPSLTCDIKDGSSHVVTVYKEIGRQLSVKQGVSGSATLPNGSYLMAADKIEQVLDLLKECITQAGLEMNREVLVYVDIGANAIYDQDKKKYELASGQWKTSDELITIYSNLLSNYAGLLGFIDPLHHKDYEGWLSITEQLGTKCLLITDKVTTDLMIKEYSINEEERPTPFVNCTSLPITGTSSVLVSDYFKQVVKLKGFCNYMMLSLDDNQSTHSLEFMMEMAVALKCKFIRMSAPIGLVAIVALSHLAQLQGELKSRSLYRPSSALLFTSVKHN